MKQMIANERHISVSHASPADIKEWGYFILPNNPQVLNYYSNWSVYLTN